ncbi:MULTISPECIES: MaoC family dehydratase [Brevibacterium]|uniref:3-hydroxyacyl-thioester dehydratase HtdZ n=2 Tax=Brevibacterium TaxID=1696 RepID=A0ABP9U4Z1_9MICO
MRTLTGIAEIESAVGTELGSSEWLTIDQAAITAFADATDDHQWIHLDEERAATGPFGTTIAHGFFTLSLLPHFSREIFAVEGVAMTINYGLNKVRFPQPVPVGSRLRDTATLTDVTRGPKGTQMIISHVIEIEGEDRPACIAEMVSLVVE